MRLMEGTCSFFEPAVNVAERLAFAEVTGGGGALDAPMESSYGHFGIEASEVTGLEVSGSTTTRSSSVCVTWRQTSTKTPRKNCRFEDQPSG